MSVSLLSPPISPTNPSLELSFTHLHVHSLYSDGLAHPIELAQKAAQLGYTSLALTDHNTLAGHPAFVLACRQYQIQPILGIELKVWHQERHGHLIVLTSNQDEYDRLSHLVRRKQRINLGDLKGCGYITTACLGGHVAQWLLDGEYHLARDTLYSFQQEFGDRLFVEIQPTFGTILPWLLSLARDLQIPVVATNDVHVVEPGYTAKGRLGLYLVPPQRMLTASWYPGYREACQHTVSLANRCGWV